MPKRRGPKMAKPKYTKMENIRHWEKVKYVMCNKHGYVFAEGFECPDCMSKSRSIFDAWEPSVEQEGEEEQSTVGLSLVAAMAREKIPDGVVAKSVYKLAICPLHKIEYVEGLNECPECKCWAS